MSTTTYKPLFHPCFLPFLIPLLLSSLPILSSSSSSSSCFRPQRRQEKPMFDADFKDLIVDEEGLDVLYYKKLKNISGSIHQEQPRVRVTKGNTDRDPPPVSSRAGSGSSSSSSRGQRSGGGIGDWNSPSGGGGGGGSSSSRSLVRSRRLDSQSSDVALQSAAFYGGGVGDRNSPADVGQRLPGQRRYSGVPVQDSVNYGGGVGGEVGDWNSLAGIGERFDGRNGGVALQASINYGGAVGGVLQPPPGYQMPLASINDGGAVGGVLQPPLGYQMPLASTNYGGAVGGGLQPPPGYQMPVTAPLISAAAVAAPAPAPPPPPKAPPPPAKKAPPPPAPPGKKAPPPPPGPKGKGGSLSVKPPAAPPTPEEEDKVMLKPLHWEKLNVNPEHSMVWDKIHKGSFQYNDDTMEALFGFVPANRKLGLEDNANGKTSEASNANARIFILDPRKSRNTAIVLKSLGTPRSELIDSLLEGHGLSVETLEKLARTVPTQEEESEILAFDGDPTKLADAESFLYSLLKAVPLAYTRASTMLFKLNYKPEILNVKESLQPMEPACNELRSHGLFLKLLEAILKAGNRLNAGTARGGAKAFNLTTLLKLSDFKSSDGKTTLLSFVVHEVVRNEGRRIVVSRKDAASKDDADSAAQPDDPVGKEEKEKELLQLGLPVVSRLSSEFLNVKKAASMDYDSLQSTLGSLKKRLDETRQLVSKCKSSGGSGGFLKEMEQFLESAEGEMKALQDEHTRVMDLVKKTTEYYQAGSSNKNPLQLFTIVKDFLGMVDRTCAEIARTLQTKKPAAAAGATSGPSSTQQDALRTRVAFPGLKEQILLVNKSKLSDSSDSEDDF